MRLTNLLIVGLIIGASAYADIANNQSIRNSNGGVMKQKNEQMLEEHKSMAMKMHQQRIQIIQTGYNCISSANDHEALRTCMVTEQQSLDQLRAQSKQQRESMKQERGNMGSMNGNHQNQQPPMGQMPINSAQPR
jgi:hypothetical protein